MDKKRITLYFELNGKTESIEFRKLNKAIKIINKYYNSFTIINTLGIWKGEKNLAYKAEIIQDEENQQKIIKLCNELKKEFNQESIYITKESIQGGLY